MIKQAIVACLVLPNCFSVFFSYDGLEVYPLMQLVRAPDEHKGGAESMQGAFLTSIFGVFSDQLYLRIAVAGEVWQTEVADLSHGHDFIVYEDAAGGTASASEARGVLDAIQNPCINSA